MDTGCQCRVQMHPPCGHLAACPVCAAAPRAWLTDVAVLGLAGCFTRSVLAALPSPASRRAFRWIQVENHPWATHMKYRSYQGCACGNTIIMLTPQLVWISACPPTVMPLVGRRPICRSPQFARRLTGAFGVFSICQEWRNPGA